MREDQQMAKCIGCNREIDDSILKYYGVIERYHYDDRHDTAAIDTGPTTFKPVALLRIGVCPYCNKQGGKKDYKNAIRNLLVGIGFLTVMAIVMAVSKDGGGTGAGILGFVGIIMIITGIAGIVKTTVKKAASGDFATFLIEGKLMPEWVVFPHTEKEISVARIEGTLSNRHDYSYQYIGEKELKKPDTGKGKDGSKEKAKNTLRRWAKENGLA